MIRVFPDCALRCWFPLLLLLGGMGCAGPEPTPVTLASWQRSVEQYVTQESSGDPNALRDLTWGAPNASRRGFAVLGGPLADQSTDAVGILLAHREIEGRPWFIFLVGLVRSHVIQDLRLAALDTDGIQFHWLLSVVDAHPLNVYRRWRPAPSSTLLPEGAARPFPAGEDVFDLAVTGNHVVVTHRQSGASWSLTVRQTIKAADTQP